MLTGRARPRHRPRLRRLRRGGGRAHLRAGLHHHSLSSRRAAARPQRKPPPLPRRSRRVLTAASWAGECQVAPEPAPSPAPAPAPAPTQNHQRRATTGATTAAPLPRHRAVPQLPQPGGGRRAQLYRRPTARCSLPAHGGGRAGDLEARRGGTSTVCPPPSATALCIVPRASPVALDDSDRASACQQTALALGGTSAASRRHLGGRSAAARVPRAPSLHRTELAP